MSAHTLTVRDVSKSFPDQQVLETVSTRVESTERVAVIGPSGAGKTTFLRILAGALEPDTGTVTLDGAPIERGDVALAYQAEALVRSRTALQNVMAGQLGAFSWLGGLTYPILHGESERAHEALEAVDLGDKKRERVDELSAGERGRVAVARALVQDGPALLADEPTANLDRSTRERVLDVLESAAGDRLLLVVLHDVSLATDRFDRLLGFRDGRLTMDTPAAAVDDARLRELFGSGRSPRASNPSGTDPTVTTDQRSPWYG